MRTNEGTGGAVAADSGSMDAASMVPGALAAQRVSLTPSAVRRIGQLREKQGNPSLMLRLTVSGGGCSGFQYGFDFDTTCQEDDFVFEQDGVSVVVDASSLDLVAGSRIDFVEELLGSYFQVINPLATASCGCGTSFAV